NQKTKTFEDQRDGQVYHYVKIGNQVWMAENLNTAFFRNGDSIKHVKTNKEWRIAGANQKPAWCYYRSESTNDKYGKLYNWYAVNDPRGLAPEGWHIPSDKEWKTLEKELGMSENYTERNAYNRGTNKGSKLASNKELWKYKSWHDNAVVLNETFNSTGFNAVPAGFRNGLDGISKSKGYRAYFWTSTPSSENHAWYRRICSTTQGIGRLHLSKSSGFSVRCIK
ncbi:MAG: fibrobacter succinogenes major paralogous domain-containing protein, partial [Bacteroidales bacterium]